MPEKFTPSKPIGSTDQSDSPIVSNEEVTENSSASSVCYHGGDAYSEGSEVCINGKIHTCRGGSWEGRNRYC